MKLKVDEIIDEPLRAKNNIFSRLVLFLGMGIFFALMVIAIILFSYVLLIGGIIGLCLFAIAWIKSKFFSKKKIIVHGKASKGQIYDHEEFK